MPSDTTSSYSLVGYFSRRQMVAVMFFVSVARRVNGFHVPKHNNKYYNTIINRAFVPATTSTTRFLSSATTTTSNTDAPSTPPPQSPIPYPFADVEAKWQAYWEEHNTFVTPERDTSKPKKYVLDMFPYPSGAGLHVGHPEGYTGTKI